MTEGFTWDLVAAALCTSALATLVLQRHLGWPLAAATAALKVGFVVAWFAVFDAGQLRGLDDVTYYTRSSALLASGADPLTLLVDPRRTAELFLVAGGQHVGYYVWNVLALWLFGDHYWSAILLNVLCTAVAAGAVARLLSLTDAAPGYRRAALVFFALHWDVIAWSSLLNIKDSLVLALSAWFVAWGTSFALRPKLRPLAGMLATGAALAFVRWYVPVLFAGAYGLHAALGPRGTRRAAVLAGSVLLLLVLRPLAVSSGEIQPSGVAGGSVRFLLTPRPWGIEPNYAFLLLPAVLHWLCLPLALVGAYQLWKRAPALRVALVYCAVLVLFYGAVPLLQGPRQRFQATFVLALLQFHGLYAAFRAVLARPLPAPAGHASPARTSGVGA
jgi:hypothetical protein